MTHQTWISEKAIRPLFAEPVIYELFQLLLNAYSQLHTFQDGSQKKLYWCKLHYDVYIHTVHFHIVKLNFIFGCIKSGFILLDSNIKSDSIGLTSFNPRLYKSFFLVLVFFFFEFSTRCSTKASCRCARFSNIVFWKGVYMVLRFCDRPHLYLCGKKLLKAINVVQTMYYTR